MFSLLRPCIQHQTSFLEIFTWFVSVPEVNEMQTICSRRRSVSICYCKRLPTGAQIKGYTVTRRTLIRLNHSWLDIVTDTRSTNNYCAFEVLFRKIRVVYAQILYFRTSLHVRGGRSLERIVKRVVPCMCLPRVSDSTCRSNLHQRFAHHRRNNETNISSQTAGK